MKKLVIAFLIALCFSQTALAWKISTVIDTEKPSIGDLVYKDSTFGSLYTTLHNVGRIMSGADNPIRNYAIEVGEGQCNDGIIILEGSVYEFKVGFSDCISMSCEEMGAIKRKRSGNEAVGYAVFDNPKSIWQTKDGVKIGTTLAELETLYGDIKFFDFERDYGFRGRMSSTEKPLPKNFILQLAIEYGSDKEAELEYNHILLYEHEADGLIHSKNLSSKIKQLIKVDEMQMVFNYGG